MITYDTAWYISFTLNMLVGAMIGFVAGYCGWYYREAMKGRRG